MIEHPFTRQHRPDYRSAVEFADLVRQAIVVGEDKAQGGTRLVVLSACRSAVTRNGANVFNGVAQKLIQAGIPAIVAMQFPIDAKTASLFAKRFYALLVGNRPVVEAFACGLTGLSRESPHWYRPVLYLRWQDSALGNLFAEPADGSADPALSSAMALAQTIPAAEHLVEIAVDTLRPNCERIRLMKEYKEIHDRLQIVESTYLTIERAIATSRTPIPTQQIDWPHLSKPIHNIQAEIAGACEAIEESSFAAESQELVHELKNAASKLIEAWPARDTEQIYDALQEIFYQLNMQIFAMNERMMGVFRTIELSAIVEDLTNVYNALREHADETARPDLESFKLAIDDLAQYPTQPARLAPFDLEQAPTLAESDCPYQGLSSFDEGSHAFFYGREALVEEMITRLRAGERMLFVLGASGCGKSSLVRAGLIPTLRQGGLGDSKDWRYVTLIPGATPVESLRLALRTGSNTQLSHCRVGPQRRRCSAAAAARTSAHNADRRRPV